MLIIVPASTASAAGLLPAAEMFAAVCSATLVSTLSSNLILSSATGFSQAVYDELQREHLADHPVYTTTADFPVAALTTTADSAHDLLEATPVTGSYATPCFEPYQPAKSTLWHFPNTDQERPAELLRTVDPASGLILGEQENEYGGEQWQKLKDLLAHYKGAFCYENSDLLDGMRQPSGDTLKHIGEFP